MDTDEMYEMLNEFNNEMNELKSGCLPGQDEEIADVIENLQLVYSNQLKFFEYVQKNKQGTPKKGISLQK